MEYETIKIGISNTSEAEKGKDIYYRCLKCKGVIPSAPKDSVGCDCGNIFIDVDYIRLAVTDLPDFEVLRRLRA